MAVKLLPTIWLLSIVVMTSWGNLLFGEVSPENIDQAEDLARNSYIERFTKFLQDKNVMGKVTTPDGKAVNGGRKNRFNRDDGAPFQSDLTYHDNTFNTPEQIAAEGDNNDKNNKNTKQRTLFAFVSEHGKISGAGGSSILERTVYGLHDKFSKEDEDPNRKSQDDDKTGTRFRSIFKIETQQVFNKNDKNADPTKAPVAKANNNKEDDEPIKVERVTLREEAKNAIIDIGSDSFETVKRAAKDAGREEDASTMPNMTFLYESAKRATKAIFDGTLANLGQRVINRGIRAGLLDKPQLSQDLPSCDEWAVARGEELNAQLAKAPPQVRKQLQEELQRLNTQCKQMASVDYKTINPRFEREESDKPGEAKEVLKTGDLNKEDSIARDSRIQLEIMAKAGKRVSEVPSNWKYQPNEEQSKLKEYNSKGEVVGERIVTPQSQLEDYNTALEEAQAGYEEVKAKLPDLAVPDLSQYSIEPNSKSMMEINRPTSSQLEEFGVSDTKEAPPATNYNTLQKQVQ